METQQGTGPLSFLLRFISCSGTPHCMAQIFMDAAQYLKITLSAQIHLPPAVSKVQHSSSLNLADKWTLRWVETGGNPGDVTGRTEFTLDLQIKSSILGLDFRLEELNTQLPQLQWNISRDPGLDHQEPGCSKTQYRPAPELFLYCLQTHHNQQ